MSFSTCAKRTTANVKVFFYHDQNQYKNNQWSEIDRKKLGTTYDHISARRRTTDMNRHNEDTRHEVPTKGHTTYIQHYVSFIS